MTDDEIASILLMAVKQPDWVLVSSDNLTVRWRTRDSSVFAYYFRNDPPWSPSAPRIGPDYALWVQTAAVDTAWKRSNQPMPANHSTGYGFIFDD
jgi:hypothetical protein